MNIVILAPSSEYDPASLPALPASARVAVISWIPSASEQVTSVRVARPSGAFDALRRVASGSLPGRVLARLTPLDGGATFWRATRRSAPARTVIRSADLLVAVERDAAYAAWRWGRAARRHKVLPTVFGYPAARAQIERLSA